MSRNIPALIVAACSGAVASIVGGFLIASWTIGGITPAEAAPPHFAQAREAADTDSWREAGYEKIGLWDDPSTYR